MTREKALEKVRTGWAMWKPGKEVTEENGNWHRESIFTGIQIMCTREEWEEVITALSE